MENKRRLCGISMAIPTTPNRLGTDLSPSESLMSIPAGSHMLLHNPVLTEGRLFPHSLVLGRPGPFLATRPLCVKSRQLRPTRACS
jgi:hypothetical protein